MARQTEVVLLLILASAATIFATDFDKLVKEAEERQVDSKCSTCCPVGWVKYERGCFKYHGSHMDWASAENHCLNLGGHLVSIHSENENLLVRALVRSHDPYENSAWIGLSGCQKKFNFYWSDGTKLSYTNWHAREPNNDRGECCVHINYGAVKQWNDNHCNAKFSFVCAKRLQQ